MSPFQVFNKAKTLYENTGLQKFKKIQITQLLFIDVDNKLRSIYKRNIFVYLFIMKCTKFRGISHTDF